jgi:uncharacterized protein (DUF934 family)
MIALKFIDPSRDAWHPAIGEDGPLSRPDPLPGRLLNLEQWHAVRLHWPQAVRVGLLLPNDADVQALAADLPRIDLIALKFPKWTDGRAYSQARTLRRRLRFGGEVRATGDVLVDMLPLLSRTGFDAVVLRHDQDRDAADRALAFFDAHYQGDVVQPWPLFRPERVAAPGAADGHPVVHQGAGI